MVGKYRYRSAIIFPMGIMFEIGSRAMKKNIVKKQYWLFLLHSLIMVMTTVIISKIEIMKAIIPSVKGGTT